MTHTPATIAELLESCHTIAVVGLSSNPHRASHEVAQYMQLQGYRIIPINPTYAGTYILGEPCYASLEDAATALSLAGQKIDMVDCFRRPEAIMPIAKAAITIGARCLWLQLGVINDVAIEKAVDAGLDAVMDRCLKIEHMHWQVK